VSTALTSTVSAASATCGSNLVLNKYASNNNVRFALYQAQTIQTAAADDNAVTFAITVADGYQFKATAVEFYACKAGTDNGTIDVSWKDAGGKTALWTAQSPNRNNVDNNYYSFYSKEITNQSTATEGECSLIVNIYNVGAMSGSQLQKKDLGLAQILIKGTVTDKTTGISTSGVCQLQVPELSGRKAKEISGFIYLTPEKEETTNLKLLAIKNIRLIKFRKKELPKDSVATDKKQPIDTLKTRTL
jgi:hypothetical protein